MRGNLLIRIAALEDQVSSLIKGNDSLLAEIIDLKNRLNRNSKNSSVPPSTEGLKKPPANRNCSLRQPSNKKSGGQVGHKGNTLHAANTPDHVVRHQLSSCPKCSANLSNTISQSLEKRQVFDIPQPQMEVTEHQVECKFCPACQALVKGVFPESVKAPVQYGDNLASWSVYLSTQNFIPEDRLKQIFLDIFSVNIATGTLTSFNRRIYDNLESFEAHTKNLLLEVAVKHLDETGYRMGGRTAWLHSLSTQLLTHYHVSAKRKSLINGLRGIVVHDHWKPYFQLSDVEHALCNAHHLRELNARIEDGEKWAKKMKKLLLLMLKIRNKHGQNFIPESLTNRLLSLYEIIIDEGIAYHQYKKRPKLTKSGKASKAKENGHNLLLRLKYYAREVLRFLYEPNVPFTNNTAEQDLRMMKSKQKITGGFKTDQGAIIFARNRGFISTARKQGWNILEAIQLALSGSAPMPS